jgi:ketosteroid isomerase-like protein
VTGEPRPVDVVAARDAIAVLLAEYCHRCDDGDVDALLDRFTADATFVFADHAVTGHEQLRAWFESTQSPERRGKHITANVIITVEGDRAAAASDFVFYGTNREGRLVAMVAGRYTDDLVIDDGRWRFRRRVVTAI